MEKRNLKKIPSSQIDEQIDFYLQRHHADVQDPPTFRAIHTLQEYYAPRSDAASPLERVRQRLNQQVAAHSVIQLVSHPDEIAQPEHGTIVQRERQFPQKPPRRVGAVFHALGLLAAALLLVLLVGSLVAVLSFTHPHQQTTRTGQSLGVTPTAMRSSFGKTLYTRSDSGDFQLAWSPDSKRVASLSGGNLQIWDATTGKHLVNVHFPGSGNEEPSDMSWSPNSQMIALVSLQNLLVVNGQTGAIIRSYPDTAAVAGVSGSGGGAPLSARIPASGGVGFGSPAWSPDGKLIAVTVYHASGGEILVWNPQTNAVVFEIGGEPILEDIGWSSDGQYLAGTIADDAPDASDSYVAAWKVSTRQLVFKQDVMNYVGLGLLWQPHSDNLAFAQLTSAQSGSTFEIWNVPTNTQIKSYSLGQGVVLAWSPDGKYLAFVDYSGYGNLISIIDASSGQLVYTYKGYTQRVFSLAWSPNGKYIVSSGGDQSGGAETKVWTAE